MACVVRAAARSLPLTAMPRSGKPVTAAARWVSVEFGAWPVPFFWLSRSVQVT
ncbi:hypothetical protein ACIPRL_37065 [Streptomyces sp. NPDC090085]|uniref:hypothetical protein n=1 Tax=Streptomyces sp. NPDC090085 TaxID=3365943 RepID=UPI0038106BCF